MKLTDGTHHSPKNYPKGNYKYITAKNIKNEGVVLDGVTYVDDETHHEIFSRCNPEYGDILYIKDGATTGVVAINNLEEEFSLLSSYNRQNELRPILKPFALLFPLGNLKTKCAEKLSRAHHKRHPKITTQLFGN